ncbi:aldehyde dehydrogenase [Pyricularia oryzae Y34]|uniref:Aldehyde dehydrogenase n=2 Tax=Pyricularia oryzae TaxID=318829 RepID=A0AA97P0F3_PYRO3|nr:aldehyde dehydrogenase [Pyricularia oryzae Y34]
MSLVTELKTPVTGAYQQPTGVFINNEWVEGVDKKTFETINPSTEEVICSVSEATEKDVDIAVKAARKAFEGEWKQTAPGQRSKLLTNLAELVEKNLDLLAAVESLDNGKSLAMAKGDVGAVAGCLRYYGGWADKIEGKTIDIAPDMFHYTRSEPIGVCGQIIPWNFPLLMLAWKLGPALATGNTIVLKTAEQTPLSALVFANLIKEAGFPAGVVNIISGFGKVAGAAISAHMDIDKVAFTGSTVVGRTIMKAAASSNLKKVTLELGGKSPNIIFNDADIEAAVSWVNFGIYYNHGQCCCAGSRIYVQEGVYDKFVAAFKERAEKNKVGDPFKEDTFQGPQVSELQFNRIMEYIKSGKEEGATVETGGERHGDKGYFIQPTIFSNVRPEMKIMKEEIFGPVVAMAKFKTEEEVIALANDTNYGLAAAVHTKDLNTSIRVSNALKAGTVWVNCYNMLHHQLPFGGFKESGIGRELGEAALANYTQNKSYMDNEVVAQKQYLGRDQYQIDTVTNLAYNQPYKPLSRWHTGTRSLSAAGGREKTPFEQQREALIGEIAMSFEQVLANMNKLNRSLEAVITVGNEFSSVEALWSQFENVMAKDPDEGKIEGEGSDGDGEQQRDEENR